jgi:hypothetical protein
VIDDRDEINEVGLPLAPVKGSIGEFIFEALPEELWKRVGIIDTKWITPDELSNLHKHIGRPMIAALGTRAERFILKTTIYVNDYVTIQDPQYVSNDKRDEYGLQLEEISKRKNIHK